MSIISLARQHGAERVQSVTRPPLLRLYLKLGFTVLRPMPFVLPGLADKFKLMDWQWPIETTPFKNGMITISSFLNRKVGRVEKLAPDLFMFIDSKAPDAVFYYSIIKIEPAHRIKSLYRYFLFG